MKLISGLVSKQNAYWVSVIDHTFLHLFVALLFVRWCQGFPCLWWKLCCLTEWSRVLCIFNLLRLMRYVISVDKHYFVLMKTQILALFFAGFKSRLNCLFSRAYKSYHLVNSQLGDRNMQDRHKVTTWGKVLVIFHADILLACVTLQFAFQQHCQCKYIIVKQRLQTETCKVIIALGDHIYTAVHQSSVLSRKEERMEESSKRDQRSWKWIANPGLELPFFRSHTG